MIISAQATDTIYQTILQLLKGQGIEENEPLQQRVLLNDTAFVGYRFIGDSVQVDWLAQPNLITAKNNRGEVIFQQEISIRVPQQDEMSLENEQIIAAA